MTVTVAGLQPRRAAVIGTISVLVVTAVVAPIGNTIGHAAQALLLVVPVVATAIMGGRRPAELVAGVATLMFTLVLPPVGSLRLRFTEDIVALIVFSAVAFTIGGVVARRVETFNRLEQQRAALLRSVSHDLRTPLAAIRAAVSELETDSLYDEAARRHLVEHVGDEAERLDRLVANLLSLARIEGGGLTPHRQSVDLAELVSTTSKRLGHVLDRTEVVVDVDPNVPAVFADYTLLEQVVSNLLENAARHGPSGAPINVAVHRVRHGVQIVVSDRGPGVPPAERDTIFEPFQSRGAAAGSGIGLAICKAVVESHGGTIAVGDSSDGGAAFTVTLPVS